MGLFDGITDGISDIVGAFEGQRNARDARHNSKQDTQNYYIGVQKRRNVAATNKYDPTYESQLIGTYKRSQSPAARAYLESMLTGDNAQASAAPWDDQSVAAHDRSMKRYGSYDDLLDQGEQHRSETPWKTKTPGNTSRRGVDHLARGETAVDDYVDRGDWRKQ